jgi:hypothetical protein
MAVLCSSWFAIILLSHFLDNFDMVPIIPVFVGISFVFTFHTHCICYGYYYYYYY